MKELFRVKDLVFNEEDYLDDITEFEDIIPIIKELEEELDYEKIACVDINDCCEKSKDNYLVEIHGYINEDDEFITKKELDTYGNVLKNNELSLFVINVYMCVDCGKWIINILE